MTDIELNISALLNDRDAYLVSARKLDDLRGLRSRWHLYPGSHDVVLPCSLESILTHLESVVVPRESVPPVPRRDEAMPHVEERTFSLDSRRVEKVSIQLALDAHVCTG